jgi:hypothetical protein
VGAFKIPKGEGEDYLAAVFPSSLDGQRVSSKNSKTPSGTSDNPLSLWERARVRGINTWF